MCSTNSSELKTLAFSILVRTEAALGDKYLGEGTFLLTTLAEGYSFRVVKPSFKTLVTLSREQLSTTQTTHCEYYADTKTCYSTNDWGDLCLYAPTLTLRVEKHHVDPATLFSFHHINIDSPGCQPNLTISLVRHNCFHISNLTLITRVFL